ncbi:kinase-like domain-containing protein [Tanacetum coccineum]
MSFTGPSSVPLFIRLSLFTRRPWISADHPYSGTPSRSAVQPISGYMDWPINQQILGDLDHCIIPLEDIIQATNNFAEENIIEKDYNSTVYKGELAGKKLSFILANEGYVMEIHRVVMYSSLPEHKTIVPFIGCCVKDGKMILVLEHPTRGSLSKYVSGAHLTWLMRVKISLDIASGLYYLSNNRPCETYIGDLKSANIHLDENWQAKILLIAPSPLTYPVDIYGISLDDKGRLGNDDRLYIQTGMQSKIYAFGVILFELLCARLAVTYDEEGGTLLFIKFVRSHYEKGTLTEIIDPLLKVQMNRDSIAIYSEVAYRCLNEDPSLRPRIWVVIEQLQKVLKLQQGFEISELQQVSYCEFPNVVFPFS